MTDLAKKRLSLEGYYKTDTYHKDFQDYAASQGWESFNRKDMNSHQLNRHRVDMHLNGMETILGPDGKEYVAPAGNNLNSDSFIKWNENRGEEAFHAKYSEEDFGAMTLDELEAITSGKWQDKSTESPLGSAMEYAANGENFKQDQDWDRDIEDLTNFAWE